ncbi:tape measure protein [Luteimonas sp. Sa2BVA3]|uniref:Tape measure protein n=1 Tax=Luteimonas colneyensis TaxID=2762230 RepID=A0ABR8UHH0_9GAMM|nr:tape measure protein [Luteimonas colneyensis]MBD7987109.1 tape measure protein [Luteimonas colneyensis]
MAVRNVLEEKIRLYVEAAGDEELKRLVEGLGDLGDVADEQAGVARKAMQRLADAMDAIGKVDAFDKLKRSVQAAETELEEAQQAAQRLFREMAGAETTSPKAKREAEAAARRVNQLTDAVQRQRQQLQAQRGDLAAVGIDTRRLGTAQGELRRQMGEARTALASAARSVGQYRSAATRAAADVPAANERIARSYDGIGGALQRLRGLAAPVLALLTFRSAAQGVKALGDVQQQLENARRAMAELYGSQEEGNRVFGQLEVLAKRNGLAIGDIVEQAKRMKAFGIDPLNGSLQALVDQNAAAGGSMQDLEGKVLAVGQAWAKQKLQGEEILQLVERGVPVWDLLQKATGKNVQELQKLSEKGELGRQSIAALIEEIGRANEGAASRSLGTLSGLLSQASARWLQFKQDVVEAGLGQYLKDQLASMLGATGDMAGLAKRVSDAIIGSIEALKRFGLQLAPVAKAIGTGTIALGRHAEAVLYLAKVYAVLKIAQLAGQFSALTRAKLADAVASDAAAAAAGRHTAATTGLGGALSRLPRLVRIGIAVAGVDWAIQQMVELGRVMEERQAAAQQVEAYERGQRQLQQEQLLLGRQLQQVYREYSGTAVQSAAQLNQMTRDQAAAYQFALANARQYYAGVIREARAAADSQAEAAALEQWKALGLAQEQAKARLLDLDRAAASSQGVKRFVADASEKFDELTGKGKTAAAAIKGAFDGIDLGSADGLQKAAGLIESIGVRGTAAGKAIEDELTKRLAQLSAEELTKVEAAATRAFAAGAREAKIMADAIDGARLSKLGVDLDAIRTGFSKAGREVTTAFADMVADLGTLGLTAEQRSAAVAQAFDNAFRQTSTKQELQALKASLQDALNAGHIGFEEFQRRVAQVDAQLAQLAGTAAAVPAAMGDGLARLGGQLQDVAGAAESATDQMAKGVDGVAKSSEKASQETQGFGVALDGLSDELIKAYFATNRYVNTVSSGIWSDAMNRITAEANAQAEALARLNDEYDRELAKQDPLVEAMEKLKAQYPYVQEAQLRATAEKQARLEEQKRRARDEAQALRDEARRERDEAIAAAQGQGGGSTGPVRSAALVERRVAFDVRTDEGERTIEVPEDQAEIAMSIFQELRRAQRMSTRAIARGVRR